MRTASKILLLVGGIVSFVTAFTLFIVSIVFLVCSAPEAKESIVEGINNGTITSSFPGNPVEQAEKIQALFAILGIVFIIWVFLCIANGILALIGRSKQNKPMLIINIVFGILSCVTINFVGGIFGLIANSRE